MSFSFSDSNELFHPAESFFFIGVIPLFLFPFAFAGTVFGNALFNASGIVIGIALGIVIGNVSEHGFTITPDLQFGNPIFYFCKPFFHFCEL